MAALEFWKDHRCSGSHFCGPTGTFPWPDRLLQHWWNRGGFRCQNKAFSWKLNNLNKEVQDWNVNPYCKHWWRRTEKDICITWWRYFSGSKQTFFTQITVQGSKFVLIFKRPVFIQLQRSKLATSSFECVKTGLSHFSIEPSLDSWKIRPTTLKWSVDAPCDASLKDL